MGDPIKDIVGSIRKDLAVIPERLSEFSPDGFRKIEPIQSKDSRIVFIDGGNAELIAAPSFCLHFIRIHHVVYRNNSRVRSASDEFYVLASSTAEDDRIIYRITLFPYRTSTLPDSFFMQTIQVDSMDRSLCTGRRRLDICVVAGLMRRIAELSTALVLTKTFDRGDSIVIDGDLEADADDERKILLALKSVAEKKGVIISALAKTSGDLTRSGKSMIYSLLKIAPDSAWYYLMLEEDGVGTYYVKLHRGSDYLFKLELFGTENMADFFGTLARNSADPVFLGYPYGLIDADRFARISNKELDYLRTMFAAKAGSVWKDIERQARARDAHSVLDNMSW